MISVIVPAHNEGAVIGETLRVALEGLDAATAEVLVVCNGCTDDTAAVAARAGPLVRVLESPAPSKVKAVNMGLREARGSTVVCMDADIRLSGEGILRLAEALAAPGVMAAAPKASMDFGSGAAWMVRAYYRVWLSLPYVAEGMMGCGVYALNAAGRARIGELPEIIADDGFVRASFLPSERVRVDRAVALVRAPRTLKDLIKIKTRSRLGSYQLNARFGGRLPGQNERVQHRSAWLGMLGKPALWPSAVAYLYINFITRRRARRQMGAITGYVWERDESTRQRAAQGASA